MGKWGKYFLGLKVGCRSRDNVSGKTTHRPKLEIAMRRVIMECSARLLVYEMQVAQTKHAAERLANFHRDVGFFMID